ncbi:MAG: hypothetical protein M3Y37_04495 [Chloroflexota bacterium]|jgi:hypothetical protein|nr:hypothetical protein [Chloroflexota bacterium]
MATRLNGHEERLATLTSVMNVIAVLEQSHPRRSVADRWLDLRMSLPAFDTPRPGDESWDHFAMDPRKGPEKNR